jgi:hypothetical protein
MRIHPVDCHHRSHHRHHFHRHRSHHGGQSYSSCRRLTTYHNTQRRRWGHVAMSVSFFQFWVLPKVHPSPTPPAHPHARGHMACSMGSYQDTCYCTHQTPAEIRTCGTSTSKDRGNDGEVRDERERELIWGGVDSRYSKHINRMALRASPVLRGFLNDTQHSLPRWARACLTVVRLPTRAHADRPPRV